MRSAADQASKAANDASNTATQYGSAASNVNSQLFPFLTRELNSPQGYTQQQQTAQLGNAMAGTGGATAGINTEANLASARNRNSGGFSGALDQAAREQEKNLAGAAEGIASKNAALQQTQQQGAAEGLSHLYGMDTQAQMRAMGIVPEDVNAEVNANKSGWFQNLTGLLASINGAGYKTSSGGGMTL